MVVSCGGVFVMVCLVVVLLWCFCGGVLEVFLWWCSCGGVFVVAFLWWCSCGGVCVVVFFGVWRCFCEECGVVLELVLEWGVVVFLGWCFCDCFCGVFVVV